VATPAEAGCEAGEEGSTVKSVGKNSVGAVLFHFPNRWTWPRGPCLFRGFFYSDL
jgi:hypothetical protein